MGGDDGTFASSQYASNQGTNHFPHTAMRTTSLAAALLGFSSSAYAQIATASQNGLSYSFSVPDTTASSGSGDVYIQISCATSNTWCGLGSGSRMFGSNMFIIYTNAAGNNVTLSPRTASGQSEPSYDSSVQAVLTEGSGVSNGMMTANILCSNCADKFDITSSSASLIYAARSGSALNDDSPSASIQQHSGSSYGTLSLDMSTARNTANNNPFAASSSGTTTGGTTGTTSGSIPAGCVPASQVAGGNAGSGAATSAGSGSGSGATATASPTNSGFGWWNNGGSRPTGRPNFFGDDDDDNNQKVKRQQACPEGYVLASSAGGGNNGFGSSGQDPGRRNMLIAHGVMAGLAFAVSFPGLVWFHAGVQIFAYLFYTVAFGLGIYMANDMERIDEYHPVIGIIVFVMIFFMPILGQLHHRNFKKYQRRTGVSYAHVWTGRLIIPLGIINGGLGFKFADNTNYGHIVYAVVAGIFGITYIVAVVIGERRRAANKRNLPPKYDEIAMENQSLRDGAPTDHSRHREYYASERK